MRFYDSIWGWGTILREDEGLLIVRFDADPWREHFVPRREN